MTSTILVQTEIRRFLRSEDSEVLCITGKWGVGKTYTWQTELDRARAAQAVGLKRYSYVSLFGLNSLEGLKLSIFENLEFLDAPPASRLEQAVQIAKSVVPRAKTWSDLASGLPYIGGALAKAGPLYFSAVRNQIICIDDLERRGSGLSVKDVFGLISFLREQRGCKIVLLLNADALEGEGQAEFETYFEKVVDARLVFVPTAAEAITIALKKDDTISNLLRQNCGTLNISNIRVIKKIERLARQIEPLLEEFAPEITPSALKSLALFGWSKFQPDEAPPIEYYRVSSFERYFDQKDKKSQPSPQEREWDALLTKYQFTHMDDLDKELWAFVDSGILDPDRINSAAAILNEQVQLQRSSGSYEQSWRPFHDSFEDNLDEVAKSIVDGLRKNIAVVSLSNFDTTVKLLKEFGKLDEAKEVIDFYMANKKGDEEFWNASHDPFQRGPYDPEVAAAIAKRTHVDKPFVFDTALISVGKSYDAETIKKLAAVPVDEYYKAAKSKKGDDLRNFILAALGFRRISNASADMQEVIRRMEEALKRIAAESQLNAIRIRKYGIDV